jgi:trk system potassium uptake protein TrkH
MHSLQPVLFVLARALGGFAFAFLVPMAWALALDHPYLAYVWAGAFAFTLGSAWLLGRAVRRHRRELQPRDGFLLVTLVWVVLPLYSALALVLAMPGLDFTRAYFESMSGLTATGATALTGLDALPVSVNVWRCFLQFVGGLGIILLVVAVLPMLGLGGVQIYKAEAPGPLKDARLTPRIADTARGLWTVYFVLSGACLLAYRWGGMSWPDAFMHMCSTMGLGGFSSHDSSFGYWNSPLLEAIAMVFMLVSGVSFARYFVAWRVRSLMPLWRDQEVRAYMGVMLLAIALLTVLLGVRHYYESDRESLRAVAFHVVSLATTTGYASTDYTLWPAFAPVLLIFLGCFASCAGSTGGGIKMVRMILLVKQARRELVRAIHPRVVNPVTLSGGIVPGSVTANVLAYMLIYGGAILGLSMLMMLTGMDLETAFSAVIVCVNNIGPGLGSVGPAGSFEGLSALQHWVLTFGMLIGRLELITVLVLFTPQFWRE